DSSWLTVFEHRNCNGAANASARRGEIGDLGGPLSSDCLAHWPARNGAERTAASYFDKCRGYIVRAAYSKSVTFAEIEQPELGPAQPYSIAQQGPEHGLQVSGGDGDDFEHFGGCCLLLQRLGELLFQVGVGCANAVNVSSRLRCLRTKTGNASSALRPLVRQGHLVGILTGALDRAQPGSFLPILT